MKITSTSFELGIGTIVYFTETHMNCDCKFIGTTVREGIITEVFISFPENEVVYIIKDRNNGSYSRTKEKLYSSYILAFNSILKET